MMDRAFTIVALLAWSPLPAQASKAMVLAASRAGVVELIAVSTLETAGRIHFDFAPWSAGLNGVFASADGSLLYVEGPIPTEPTGCCWLYSVELATLQTNAVASVPGSASRNAFVVSNGVVHSTAALAPNGIGKGMG